MMKEEWRQIQGYEGLYEVSNLGQVKALDKLDSLGRKVKQKIMSPNVSTGYARVGLHKEGQKKMLLVHRLVAIAFIPNQENKTEVNHIDGNKLNNHCSNLEWCTQAENLKHARDTGLADWKVGHKKTYKSAETRKTCLANLKDKTVLTEEQVRWARQNFIARHPEFGATAMASKFGVTPTAMSNAIRGKTFKEIK